MQKNQKKESGLNRRTFLQIIAVAGAAAGFNFFPFARKNSSLHVVRKSRPMMGTTLNLTLYSHDRDQAEAAIAATLSRMETLESQLSRHKKESEVSRLNQNGVLQSPSNELREVLTLTKTISKKTGGAFDITILPLLSLYQKQGQELINQPSMISSMVKSIGYEGLQFSPEQAHLKNPGMAISLDGIGKGYIVDQGVDTLKGFGFEQVLVEAGGDLLVKGAKPGGAPWRIGIRNPRPETGGKMVTIEAENMAVATSGDYFQPFSPDLLHHHIINPHTGFSPPALASCTITAPSAALADGLATGCMVLGAEDSLDLLAGLPGCEGFFINKDLSTHQTDGFSVIT